MTDTVPSTPSPATVVLVASLIRDALKLAAGAGLAVGVYSDSTVTMVASALVGGASVAWALWQKFEAARAAHSAAVASAVAGRPVKPAS